MSGRERRIAFLANRIPWPTDDGWNMRTYHILRGLCDVGHVTVYSFADAERAAALTCALDDRISVRRVDRPDLSRSRRMLMGAITDSGLPQLAQRSAGLTSMLTGDHVENPFDALVSVTTFFRDYWQALAPRVPLIIDTHNIDSVNFGRYAAAERMPHRRWYSRRTARQMHALERSAFAEAAETWVCSDDDATEARTINGAGTYRVVPNGVDTSLALPRAESPDAPTVLFFGRLDYFPNSDAVRRLVQEIFPLVRARVPNAQLRIVGAGSVRDLAPLCSEAAGVSLVGRVESVWAELQRCHVVSVPLRVGSGTRLKVLEAMAAAAPIVCTALGAEGIEVEDGVDIVLADDPLSHAKAIISLLGDKERRTALGVAAARTAQRRYEWSAIEREVAIRCAGLLR